MKDLEQSVYESLSILSEKTGDHKNALHYKNRFLELKDSAYAADNIKRIEFLDAQYQAEKKEKEIMGLQNEKQIQALSIRQKSTLNYILIGSVIALLVVGFLVVSQLPPSPATGKTAGWNCSNNISVNWKKTSN